jgi:hypothetical protein
LPVAPPTQAIKPYNYFLLPLSAECSFIFEPVVLFDLCPQDAHEFLNYLLNQAAEVIEEEVKQQRQQVHVMMGLMVDTYESGVKRMCMCVRELQGV